MDAIKFLKRLKSNLEHARRFSPDTLGNYRNACVQAEGDIEEFLIAAASGGQPADERKDAGYLTDDDMASLHRFIECAEDFDADGHDVSKADMKRLSEIGVVRSVGFGRHGLTSFGDYVHKRHFDQKLSLPLTTVADYNRAAMDALVEKGERHE